VSVLLDFILDELASISSQTTMRIIVIGRLPILVPHRVSVRNEVAEIWGLVCHVSRCKPRFDASKRPTSVPSSSSDGSESSSGSSASSTTVYVRERREETDTGRLTLTNLEPRCVLLENLLVVKVPKLFGRVLARVLDEDLLAACDGRQHTWRNSSRGGNVPG
jgi:hypothetical protein